MGIFKVYVLVETLDMTFPYQPRVESSCVSLYLYFVLYFCENLCWFSIKLSDCHGGVSFLFSFPCLLRILHFNEQNLK